MVINLLVVLVGLAFGGFTSTYVVDVHFEDGKPTNGDQVLMDGVAIGAVTDIEREDGGWAATLEIEPEFAPVEPGAKALLRNKTLLGDTYVELLP